MLTNGVDDVTNPTISNTPGAMPTALRGHVWALQGFDRDKLSPTCPRKAVGMAPGTQYQMSFTMTDKYNINRIRYIITGLLVVLIVSGLCYRNFSTAILSPFDHTQALEKATAYAKQHDLLGDVAHISIYYSPKYKDWNVTFYFRPISPGNEVTVVIDTHGNITHYSLF